MTVDGELVDRIGVRLDPARDDTATLPMSPAVVRAGSVLVAALMLAADIASGIRLHEPGVARVLTTSFSLRRPRTETVGPITAVSTRLFSEGNRFVDRLRFENDSGDVVATGRISFVVRRGDEPPRDARSRYLTEWAQPIQQPLIDAAGMQVADPATGRVTLQSANELKRDGGILQGSFVTLLGEASALALAEHHYKVPAIVESLDVEFLAGVSHAVITEARWFAAAGESDIEVVIRNGTTGSALAIFVIGCCAAGERR